MVPKHCASCHTDWQSRFLSTVVPLWEKSRLHPEPQMDLRLVKLWLLWGIDNSLCFCWDYNVYIFNEALFSLLLLGIFWLDLRLAWFTCFLRLSFPLFSGTLYNLPEFIKCLLFLFDKICFFSLFECPLLNAMKTVYCPSSLPIQHKLLAVLQNSSSWFKMA